MVKFSNSSNRILCLWFVPFGHTTHVEAVLLEQIKQRQMRQTIPETRDKSTSNLRLMPAFCSSRVTSFNCSRFAELAQTASS